jgi:fused signal recognition particle receptor
MTETESEQVPTSDESWYCPECGRRYGGPGTCAVQHPPTQLREVATDTAPVEEAAPVKEATPVEEAPTEEAPVEEAAPAEVTPTASQQAQSLVAAIKSHADDLATLLAGL